MKTLINGSFKAVRTGEFVEASVEAEEFIFDSETCDLPVATLLEIGSANGIKLAKEKKELVAENLNTHLKTLGLPTMNDKTDTQKVAEIVAAGVAAEKTDDDMLIEIVQAGIKFKAAGKLFNQAMTEGGYRITSKNRKEECRAILVDAEFAPESYEDLQAMIERLTKEVADTATSQAFAIIRSYAKEFELELPKPPKKAAGGIRTKVFDWIVENPSATRADMSNFISTQGDLTDERIETYAKSYASTLEVANKIAEKLGA